MLSSIIIIIICSYLLWKISNSFDQAATYLTRNLNEGIKGPTINAIASSFPELLISSFFLFYIGDLQGFSAGFATIIGSSIFNIAIIPTIAFLYILAKKNVKSFPTDKSIIKQDGLFLIFTEIILIFSIFYGGISKILALTLIFIYFIYIYYIFKKRNIKKANKINEVNKHEDKEKKLLNKIIELDLNQLLFKNKPLNTFKSILILFISIFIISISCNLLVKSSESISEILNLNLFFVTFFITAIASSIPDTILSIKDAKNNKYKDSFSNAYASNIFDICIGIGLPVLIYLSINGINEISTFDNLNSNKIIFSSSILLLFFTVLITLIYWFKNLNLFRSIIIILLYIIFLTTIYYLN